MSNEKFEQNRLHVEPEIAGAELSAEDIQNLEPVISANNEQIQMIPVSTVQDQTLAQLAKAGSAGVEIIKTRSKILQSLRSYSIKLTAPEDWVLHKDREGRTVGYLSDSGCKKIFSLWSIKIYNISKEEIKDDNTGEFAYVYSADATCGITGSTLLNIEGIRTSSDKFIKAMEISGIRLKMMVSKSARANLDGTAVRKLAGMEAVPVSELISVWGEPAIERCRKGYGFGSTAEREGAELQLNGRPMPKCEACGSEMRFIPAGVSKSGKEYSAFFSCKNQNCKHTLRLSEWEKRFNNENSNGN